MIPPATKNTVERVALLDASWRSDRPVPLQWALALQGPLFDWSRELLAMMPNTDPRPIPTTPTPMPARPMSRRVRPGSPASVGVSGLGPEVGLVGAVIGAGAGDAGAASSRLSRRTVAFGLSGPTCAFRVRCGRPGDETITAWSPGS